MSCKNNKRASEASQSKSTLKEAIRSNQVERSHHASGGEKAQSDVSQAHKKVLSPSHDPSMPTPEETLEAYKRLGMLLKELYPRVRSKGYAIIDGKLTKIAVDSAKTEKSGMMLPLLDNKT